MFRPPVGVCHLKLYEGNQGGIRGSADQNGGKGEQGGSVGAVNVGTKNC